MANLAPDLKGARIERVESSEGRLTLFVEGVSQCGLRFGGRIIFEGVERVEGSDPRLPSSARVLTGGFDVFTQRNEPGATVLVLRRWTGQGETDEPRFAIFHRSVSSYLCLRPEATLRAWIGF